MKKFPILPLIRLFLGAVFLASGFLKLIEPWQNFQMVLEGYRMIEGDPARWAARIFPWIEALGGLYLIVGLYTRLAAAALWGLNTMIISALAQAIVRKLPIHDCGCFGDALSLPLPVMLSVDIVFWFAFGALFLWDKEAKRFSIDSKLANSKRGKS